MNQICIENYDDLIEKITDELYPKLAALASPTLSKQQNITYLGPAIFDEINFNKKRFYLNFVKSLLLFLPQLTIRFLLTILISRLFSNINVLNKFIYIRTWFINGSINSNGQFVDKYFSDLAKNLEKNYYVVSGLTPVSYFYLLFNYFKIKQSTNCIVPLGFLSFGDILKLFYFYLKTGFLKVNLKYHLINGKSIKSIINIHLFLDYLSFRSLPAYVEFYITKNIIKYNPIGFIYVYENQSLEKVICNTLNEKNVISIGYQSSGFSLKNTNFFYTEQDLKYRLLPCKILTTGRFHADLLEKNGCNKVKVAEFAALRFNYPNDGSEFVVAQPNLTNLGRVLYAFSSDVDDHLAIIEYLVEIFGNSSIMVDLKFHPINDKFQFKIKHLIPSNFKIYSPRNNKFSDIYDLTLFNDNSFGLESLFQGVKSFQISTYDRNHSDRFIFFQEWDHFLAKKDLLIIKDKLEKRIFDKSFNVYAVQTYLNLMFKFPDPNGNYLQEITDILIKK